MDNEKDFGNGHFNPATGEIDPAVLGQAFQSSAEVAELFAALSKAQGKMSHAAKTAENPHFKKTYAELADVLDAIREPFSTNGLALIQLPCGGVPSVKVKTLLTHSSGQWLMSTLELRPVRTDPQAVGGAITYGRRYSAMAMAGIAPADDDGNAASGRDSAPPVSQRPKTAAKPATKKSTEAAAKKDLPNHAPGASSAKWSGPTTAQIKRLNAIMGQNGWSAEELKVALSAKYDLKSVKDMTKAQYEWTCDELLPKMSFEDFMSTEDPA